MMKKLITLFLVVFSTQFSFGQTSQIDDSATLSTEIEQVVTDPFYKMLLSDGNEVELNKKEVGILNRKWISKVDIWTEEEKKKEFGYNGDRTLVLIQVKKKRELQYLELIGKK